MDREQVFGGLPMVGRPCVNARRKAIVGLAQARGALPDALLMSHGTGLVRDRNGSDEAIVTIACAVIWRFPIAYRAFAHVCSHPSR